MHTQKKENLFVNIFLNAPYQCCILDINGYILATNKKMQQLLNNFNFESNYIFNIFSEKYKNQITNILNQDFEISKESMDGIIIEFSDKIQHKNKLRMRWYTCSQDDELNECNKFIVLIFNQDEDNQNTELSIQNQRIEILGHLAASIAHDFSNLLSVINGYASFIQQAIHTSHPIYGDIEEILAASRLASALTRQILTFSKIEASQIFPHSLSKMITDMEFMLQRLVGDNITLQLQLDPNLPTVMLDSAKFEQAFVNLAINARDAMPDGGNLFILTEICTTEDTAELKKPNPANTYVSVVISDTGHGMDNKTLQRAFDPFFSTKKHAKGMGLTIVSEIVKQHNGLIELTSIQNKGSQVKILFPISSETETGLFSQPGTLNKIKKSKKSILVVENDEQLRGVAARILREDGYDVLVASNAGEALLFIERHKDPIHLLLSDIMMPMMNGFELADRVTRLRPNIKILFMTGYIDDITRQAQSKYPSSLIITKPFTLDTLLPHVRRLLKEIKEDTP